MSRIREQYVSTGKVRFVYKNYAILGLESRYAAEATECAEEQDTFWGMHDLIFADQSARRTKLDEASLTAMAVNLGMDEAVFSECLTSGKYRTILSNEALAIQSLGIRGTPAFLVNGVYVSGAQPFEVFQQIIETELQKVQ